jgi:hypothetical protein
MPRLENVALFDMDGTLCDYKKSLLEKLEELRSPNESTYNSPVTDDSPLYIIKRADLIRASEEWWENLPRFQLGWDILELAKSFGYRIMILTMGPKRNPASWAGKKRWIEKNLGSDIDVTITRDKGLTYGKVLVDDSPMDIERWTRKWGKRRKVIMPANPLNIDFKFRRCKKSLEKSEWPLISKPLKRDFFFYLLWI